MGVVCASNSKNKEQTTKNSSEQRSLSPQIKTRKNKLIEGEISQAEIKSPSNSPQKTSSIKYDKASRPIITIDSNVFIAGGDAKTEDIYAREKVLGKGSFGVVYLVKHKQLHKYFAMKIIKKNMKSRIDEESLRNEINILKRLDHPNILKINDFYSSKDEYFIITEYCQEGELFNEIKLYAPFTEPLVG